MARTFQDYGVLVRGIACDERTAVCIEPDGRARVFGLTTENFGSIGIWKQDELTLYRVRPFNVEKDNLN